MLNLYPDPRRRSPSSRQKPRVRGGLAACATTMAWLCLGVPATTAAQSPGNVLVVANERAPDSLTVAEHYAQRRGIPPDHVLRLSLDAAEELDRPAFERGIQEPIAAWLASRHAQDRILFIVLARGVPLRIRGAGGRDGTIASVDSELTLLYRRMTGSAVAATGPVANPYYTGEQPPSAARRFSRQEFDIYLVTRLDGYTVEDVRGLIERGVAPTNEGRILLDQKPPVDAPGSNRWLKEAADRLEAAGFGGRVALESTSRVLDGESQVLGYASWGSNDPGHAGRVPALRFVPGAIGTLFVSTDARTFVEPPASWTPGAWGDRSRFYANSPQSLAGDLVRAGITGVGAQVAEPYLDGTIRPQVLFPAYLSGFTLAEAFYMAIPYLSWQTVVVGDPLCAPFTRAPLEASEADGGLDEATETPRFFAARRLKVLDGQGAKPAAAKALLRAEARAARQDERGARAALEEATTADPSLRPAQLLLAEHHAAAGEYRLAAERYQAILAIDSKDTVALNNLAYALGVELKQPEEALAYAERAFTLAPGTPQVIDTYGWIQHLLGRRQEALDLLARAARLAPDNALVRLHAAVVYAANGMLDAARRELEEAVRLDASLEQSEEAKAVRAMVK